MVLAGVAYVGYAAHAYEKAVPFWKCFVAGACLIVDPGVHRYWYLSDTEIIVTAVLSAAGAVLAFSAVWHGHWATKIFGVIVFLPFAMLIANTLYGATQSWSNVFEYWSGS